VPLHHILYLNFEDERIDYSTFQPDLIIQAYCELFPDVSFDKVHLLLDEIQYLKNWERFIRRVYDNYTKHIYLTGSNSAFLQHNIASSLRGRTVSYQLYPLSFTEYLKFKNYTFKQQDFYSNKHKAVLLKHFKEYMMYGGFPEVVMASSDLRVKILQEYFNVMLYKDLIEQYSISDVTTLKFFLRRIIDNTGKLFSVHKIYNDFKSANISIGKDTLYNYLKYLEDVFAVFTVQKHYKSLIKNEFSERKVYPVDNGYIQALKYVHKEYMGVMLENTMRQFFMQNNFQVHFYKDKYEVDFVCFNEKGKPSLYQISLNISDEDTRYREIKSLLSACENYKLKEGYILTLDEEDEIKEGKIKINVMPAYKFILSFKR
jgi:predicted AAA+ superfamily ATPase